MLKYIVSVIVAVVTFTGSASAQAMEKRCTRILFIERCDFVPVRPMPRPGIYYAPLVETVRSANAVMERSEAKPLCKEGNLVDGPDGTKVCEKHWLAAQLAGTNPAHLEGQQPECVGKPSGTLFVRMGTGPDGQPTSLRYRCR